MKRASIMQNQALPATTRGDDQIFEFNLEREHATKKLPSEGFKRPWPPLIKMDAAVKAKMEKLLNL